MNSIKSILILIAVCMNMAWADTSQKESVGFELAYEVNPLRYKLDQNLNGHVVLHDRKCNITPETQVFVEGKPVALNDLGKAHGVYVTVVCHTGSNKVIEIRW